MKRNNVDAALIIEVSKPIAYGQYQFEKGDKLTYDMSSNLFVYRNESYSEDEDGNETTSIIAFGIDPDFVLDNADHFTCLIKKGILDKIEEDEITDTDEAAPIDTEQGGSDEDIDDHKIDFESIISHADRLSEKELEDEIVKMMTLFNNTLKCYDLSMRKKRLNKEFGDDRILECINDVISATNWALRAFHDEKKKRDEQKWIISGDCAEACDSAR